MVLHAEIVKDGQVLLLLSDNLTGVPYSVGTNISFVLQFDTEDETRAMFEALSWDGRSRNLRFLARSTPSSRIDLG